MNPYPEKTEPDESTGQVFEDKEHKAYQKGWDAREVVTKELYEALKAITRKAGTNIMSQRLCPLHGPDCRPKTCKVYKAIAHYEEGNQ